MTPVLFVLVALAGGAGAAARLLLDGAIRTRTHGRLPLGTITINLTGSLALGLLTGLAGGGLLPPQWHLVLGTGFLGGYTTFSSASLETVRLLQERAWVPAVVNGVGVVAAGTALAGLGLWLGAQV